MEAGRAHLDAVERLGLRPLGLLRAFDRVVDRFVLVPIARESGSVLSFGVATPDGHPAAPDVAATGGVAGLEADSRWVHRFEPSTTRADAPGALRRWRRSSSSVDRLAA